MFHQTFPFRRLMCLCTLLLGCMLLPYACWGQARAAVQILSPQDVEKTFPPSVFFKGQSAPIQYRNASALRFADGAMFFAGLIDNSGYASGIQEKYQMYLFLEQPLLIGGKTVAAGAYGAGFVGDHFLVMDIGGHTLAEGNTEADEHMAHPRPLQLVQSGSDGVRLYLGRRWVRIETTTSK